MSIRQRFGLVLLVLALLCCAFGFRGRQAGMKVSLISSGVKGEVFVPELPDGEISVNHGDPEELIMLPGIGETLAAEMIAERERNGPFRLPEDLMSVRGIGKSRLEGLRRFLDLSVNEEEED